MFARIWKVMAFLFIAITLTGCFGSGSVNIIDDPLRLLSSREKNNLEQKLYDNYRDNKVSIVVWLPALGKDEILADKAVEYFKSKKIGAKGIDNGLLIVVDWNNKRSRIEVGYGLEGVFTDAKMRQIMEKYMIPHFKDNKLYRGLSEGVTSLTKLSREDWKLER